MSHGKKYQAVAAKVDRLKTYSAHDAIKLVKDTAYAKFDGTVEVHIRTGLDPRQADQQIRASVVLPHGLGKTVRVLVFAEGEGARIAQEEGADYVADDAMIKKITEGWTDFDVTVATPDMMGKVGRLGKVLGPRGLMPSPKSGTVVPAQDLPKVIREAKAGRVEFRLDKTANIHVPIGKVSFSEVALQENLAAFLDAVNRAKPSAAKGNYLRRATITSTMGPGIRVDAFTVKSKE
ncbi:MAG TPA: 50S ribosomal protein L1 [Anaerolineales bacterium]|nr:50S ribosomal protein L1 [Anaerolineales bacterium]